MRSELKPFLQGAFIVVILASLTLFLWSVDFKLVLFGLKDVGFCFFILLIISFVAYLLASLSWRVCLGEEQRHIGLFPLFAIRQAGETLGLFNPTSIIAGDWLKVHLLKKYDVDHKVAMNAVLISRLTTVLSQVVLLVCTLLWLLSRDWIGPLPQFVFVLSYVILFVLMVAILSFVYWVFVGKIGEVDPIVKRASFVSQIIRRLQAVLREVIYAIRADYKGFLSSFFLALLHWIVGSLEFYFILVLLGFDITILQGLLLDMTVLVIKSAAAFIPGQLGIEELGNKWMLALIGIRSAHTWLTVSLIRRARQLVWVFLGLLLYLPLKKNITDVEVG